MVVFGREGDGGDTSTKWGIHIERIASVVMMLLENAGHGHGDATALGGGQKCSPRLGTIAGARAMWIPAQYN